MDKALVCPKCKVKLVTFAENSLDFHLPVHIDVDKAKGRYSLRCPVCATLTPVDDIGGYFRMDKGPAAP